MLDTRSNGIQCGIEGSLLFREFAPFRFFVGRLNDHSRHAVLFSSFRIEHRHLVDLLAQALIAFVGIQLAPVRQVLYGAEVITQR